MRKNKNIMVVVAIFIVAIISFITYSQCNKKYFLENDEFTEWIQFSSNGILLIFGAFATIIAVLLSINYSRKIEEEINKKQLAKICVIIHYEMNSLLSSLFDRLYEYIIMFSNANYKIEQMSTIKPNTLYKLNEDFKTMTYELIRIDNTNTSLKLFDFLKKYEVSINLINDERYCGLESLIDILSYSFNEKYSDLLMLIQFRDESRSGCETIKRLNKSEKDLLQDFIKTNRRIHCKNNFKLIKNECSSNILEIMRFLEKNKK